MNKKIICFGEVLFDVFPTHRKIGGAPLNVALRIASLGTEAHIISRIGDDDRGKELLEFAESHGLSTSAIQIDTTLPTGEVMVQINQKGSATYTINYPVAWDKISCTPEDEILVKKADAFVFGSLVCRDLVSHQALLELINYAKYTVFDVNLRAPFYTKELLIQLMMQSNFIKLNDDELFEISDFMNSPHQSLEQNMLYVAQKTNTKHICVTMGSKGAMLYYNEKIYYNSGYKITVVDTVGAGDSFLAGLLTKLLHDDDPQEAIDFACALGALVASNNGANPPIPISEIDSFRNLTDK